MDQNVEPSLFNHWLHHWLINIVPFPQCTDQQQQIFSLSLLSEHGHEKDGRRGHQHTVVGVRYCWLFFNPCSVYNYQRVIDITFQLYLQEEEGILPEWASTKWTDNTTVMDALNEIFRIAFKILFINGNAKRLYGGILLGNIIKNMLSETGVKAFLFSEVCTRFCSWNVLKSRSFSDLF